MEDFFDVLWKLFQDLFLRLGPQNCLLSLIFELCDLASQRVFLEVGLDEIWELLDVSFLGLSEEFSFDLTLVADEELLFVDTAPIWMSLGHVTSELLRLVELLAANFALVHRSDDSISLFLRLLRDPFIFSDSLYLVLILERFKNV